ncbi:3-hydroxyacyl-CoA dehydrogenase NAD-binding domain-containing protein [Desulfovibrio oxyclinae]|uniref:3-hydroxyacyl-CoA dehydrogenase NAD-binding domain-containing protein n=1 Tax=Desulfovibrio oxyclinae TaxID=63560 RepID=UPI0003799FCD|nr:3-hydroxyacyl-CoA dehydrogenase NAD-binding domain-containing protein [Desulfovibrio oxyclinae]
MIDIKDIKTVGILGAGVIGGGWALHFLRNGFDVVAFDPGPGAKEKLLRMVDENWPTLEKLGLSDGASKDRLRFADSLKEMVEQVQFIQESAPENLESKQELYKTLGELASPDTILCSSTSGFAMSDIQKKCDTPERTVVGHPFNPPYLVPFMEVVGGDDSDPRLVDKTAEFFESTGKKVIRMNRELPGFIANRLQEALWREALHMVAEGEATVDEIDASIAYGPGLRWAIMGPCLTFHMAGGEGGMAHMLDHFGPALEEPWTRLKAPELTSTLRDRMVDGCEKAAKGRSCDDLVRERDECLIRIMNALDEYRSAVGEDCR